MRVEKIYKIFIIDFLVILGLATLYQSSIFAFSQKKAYDYFSNGNYQDALEQFDKKYKKDPKDLENLYNKGVAEYKLKKYDDSTKSFASVASSSKDKNLKVQSLFNLGNAEAQLSNFDGAIASYEEALKLDPQNEKVKANLEYVKNLKEQKQNQNQNQKQDQKQNQNKDQNQDQQNKNDSKDQNQNQKQNQDSNQSQSQDQKQDSDKSQKQDQNKTDDEENQKQNNDQQESNQSQSQDQKGQDQSLGKQELQGTVDKSLQDEKDVEEKLKEKQAEAILNRVEDKAPEYMNKLNSRERDKIKKKSVDKDW